MSEVRVQCPLAGAIFQITRSLCGADGSVGIFSRVARSSRYAFPPSSQEVTVALSAAAEVTLVSNRRSVPASATWSFAPDVTAVRSDASACPVTYSVVGATMVNSSVDRSQRICDSRKSSMILAFAESLGSGVANTSLRNLIFMEAVTALTVARSGLLADEDVAGRALVAVLLAAFGDGCPADEQADSAIRPDAAIARVASTRNI